MRGRSVTKQIELVHAHEGRLVGNDLAFDQRHCFAADRLVETPDGAPVAAEAAGEVRLRHLDDVVVVLAAVGDQVTGCPDPEFVNPRQLD